MKAKNKNSTNTMVMTLVNIWDDRTALSHATQEIKEIHKSKKKYYNEVEIKKVVDDVFIKNDINIMDGE